MKCTRIQKKRWKKKALIRQQIEKELEKLGYWLTMDENYYYFNDDNIPETTIRISNDFKCIQKYSTDWDVNDNLIEYPEEFTNQELKILYKGVIK